MATDRRITGRVFIGYMLVINLSVFPHNSLIFILAGPLPTLNGITDVGTKHNASPKNCRFSPVSHDDMSYFKRTFNSAGPLDGYLDGMWF